jgi:hypothetical protein
LGKTFWWNDHAPEIYRTAYPEAPLARHRAAGAIIQVMTIATVFSGAC